MVSQANVTTQDASNHRLGWHWVWFLPLCVLILSLVERHTVIYAFELLKIGPSALVMGCLFLTFSVLLSSCDGRFSYLAAVCIVVCCPPRQRKKALALCAASDPWNISASFRHRSSDVGIIPLHIR